MVSVQHQMLRSTTPPNKELKLTKPSIMELRSLTLGGLKGTTQHFGDDPSHGSGRPRWSVNGRATLGG
jgi:hypothetical protein